MIRHSRTYFREFFLVGLLFAISPAVYAHLFHASGSISNSDSLTGFGSWGAGTTNLSWEVNHIDDMTQGGLYKTFYTYQFNHPEASTYSFVIELHPNMLADLSNSIFDVNSTLSNHELGIFSTENSFTGLPETITGVRFWGESGSTSETISFTSGYLPMWGDFFTNDKNHTTGVWNKGFTSPDRDPSSGATDGSLSSHLLVPGAGGVSVTPIPPAIWLFASGLFAFFSISKRKVLGK